MSTAAGACLPSSGLAPRVRLAGTFFRATSRFSPLPYSHQDPGLHLLRVLLRSIPIIHGSLNVCCHPSLSLHSCKVELRGLSVSLGSQEIKGPSTVPASRGPSSEEANTLFFNEWTTLPGGLVISWRIRASSRDRTISEKLGFPRKTRAEAALLLSPGHWLLCQRQPRHLVDKGEEKLLPRMVRGRRGANYWSPFIRARMAGPGSPRSAAETREQFDCTFTRLLYSKLESVYLCSHH